MKKTCTPKVSICTLSKELKGKLINPIRFFKSMFLVSALVTASAGETVQAQVFPPNCTPPSGSAIAGQLICSGFSPTVSTGVITPSANTRYRVTASVFSGNVTDFTALQTSIGANADIEPANLNTFSTGQVEYKVIPYAFGVDGLDNGGLGDDCQGVPIYVYINVNICAPVCDGINAFSDYRNTSPAVGTLAASFINRSNTNMVTITNTGTYATGKPTWTVSGAGISIVRDGGASATTEFVFNNTTNTSNFSITGLSGNGVNETVRIIGYDNAAVPNQVYPQFYNLQDGAVVTGVDNNELSDGDGGTAQASGSFYFNEPVKRVQVIQIGNSDVISVALLGCSFPSDYGDLTQGFWPVASAIVPGTMTSNVPDAYNPVTAPSVVVWAGARVGTEPFTTSGGNAAASFDTYDDGFIAPPSFTPGYSTNYQISLNANQANTKVYYRLWFDWNADGIFNDLDGNGVAATYGGSGMVTGSPKAINIVVKPPLVISSLYKTRLVIASDTITDVYRTSPNFILNLANGEVEDYSPIMLLPVELGTFTLQKQGMDALISWTALTETNFSHYDVEYSSDANFFKTVATVVANGSRNYSVTDAPVLNYNANAYYRLKMVDKNGSYKYGPVKILRWNGKTGITIGPNPTRDNLKIRLDNFSTDQKLRAVVTDAAGRKIANVVITNAVVDINTNPWTNGLYQVQIFDDLKIIYTQKIVKN